MTAFAPSDTDQPVRARSVKVKAASVPVVSPQDVNEIDLAATAPKSDAAPAKSWLRRQPRAIGRADRQHQRPDQKIQTGCTRSGGCRRQRSSSRTATTPAAARFE